MILIYLKADGRAIAEQIKHASKFIELPDGYHPMLDKGVMKDSKHRYPAVMMISENDFVPEGCDDPKADPAPIILIENELIKMGRGRPRISKLFWRRFWGFLFYLGRWVYFAFFLLIVFVMAYVFMVVAL